MNGSWVRVCIKGTALAALVLIGGTEGAGAQWESSQVSAFVAGATLNGEMVAKLMVCGYPNRAEETARKFSFITLKLLETGQYALQVQEAMNNFAIGKNNVMNRYGRTPPQSVCDEALDIDRRVNGR